MGDNGVHGNHTPGRDSKQCLMWLKGERSQRERERAVHCIHQARVLVVKDSAGGGRWGGGSVSLGPDMVRYGDGYNPSPHQKRSMEVTISHIGLF